MISGRDIISSWDVIMENENGVSVSEFIEGENEPAASWIFFILGIMVGAFAILGTMLTEATSE